MPHQNQPSTNCRYKVKIDGTKFFFDVERQELREVRNPQHTIKFDDMHYDDELFYLFYDTKTKTRYEHYVEIPELPTHVKIVAFPLEAIEGKMPPVTIRFISMANTKKERAKLKHEHKRFLNTMVSRNHNKRHRI